MCLHEIYFEFRKCYQDVLLFIKYVFRAKSSGTLHISHVFFWLAFFQREKKEFQKEKEISISNKFMGIQCWVL